MKFQNEEHEQFQRAGHEGAYAALAEYEAEEARRRRPGLLHHVNELFHGPRWAGFFGRHTERVIVMSTCAVHTVVAEWRGRNYVIHDKTHQR